MRPGGDHPCGSIVALDTPAALLAGLGQRDLRSPRPGDASVALAALGARGIAGDDAFAVGSTLTVPLREARAGDALAAISGRARDQRSAAATPTLDDVYLRLTGDEFAAAA